MKISIITINLNNSEGLRKTIESVISQSSSQYELLIIDGNSEKDDSKEVIKEYANNIHYWVSERDNGRYDAMNKGIAKATGDYLIFLNSGDYFVDRNVIKRFHKLKPNKQVYCGNILVRKEGESEPLKVGFPNQKYNLEFFLKYALPHQATFFSKQVFKDFGNYEVKYNIYADLEYYLRLINFGVEIEFLPLDIAFYDIGGDSNNAQLLEQRNREKKEIFEEKYGYPSIHFFTLVLNGQPFIQHHIEEFKKLPFKWHWHIIEGIATLTNDTAWSLSNGGKIPEKLIKNGRSIDGTSEYIDKLKEEFPENVTIYRKDTPWNGKLEMVNAPLKNINEPCLLFQLDSDEIWTSEQLVQIRELFQSDLEKHAAIFFCNYFFGPNLVLDNFNSYANSLNQDWLRVWRYLPGDFWKAHEPPILMRDFGSHQTNLSDLGMFSHLETAASGLIFQHYAYVMKSQIEFKSSYYGDPKLVKSWVKLQKLSNNKFPVKIKDYYQLVSDNTLVYKTNQLGVSPLYDLKSWKRSSKYNPNSQFNARLTYQIAKYTVNLVNELKVKNNLLENLVPKDFNPKLYGYMLKLNKLFITIFPLYSRRRAFFKKLVSFLIRIFRFLKLKLLKK